MKKLCIFLPIVIVILVVFACDLQLPEKIEIKGTPSVRFAANMKLSDLFSEMLEDSIKNDDAEIIWSTKAVNKTLLIHIDLIDDVDSEHTIIESELALNYLAGSGDSTYDVSATDDPLIEAEEVKMDLGDLMGDFLEGFEFKEVKAKLYISGSKFTEHLLVEFGVPGNTIIVDGRDSHASGFKENIDIWANYSTFASLPNHGEEIDLTELINNDDDDEEISFEYSAYLRPGHVPVSDITGEQELRAELVIWVPLEFVAKEPDGGNIELPDDFFGDGKNDLFGRNTGSGDSITGIFESMHIKIEMNNSPFNGGNLFVESGVSPDNIEINTPLGDDSFEFKISEEDMAKINSSEYFPFVPKFNIHFDPHKILRIPSNFMTTAVYFEAKMKYTYDLAGE